MSTGGRRSAGGAVSRTKGVTSPAPYQALNGAVKVGPIRLNKGTIDVEPAADRAGKPHYTIGAKLSQLDRAGMAFLIKPFSRCGELPALIIVITPPGLKQHAPRPNPGLKV